MWDSDCADKPGVHGALTTFKVEAVIYGSSFEMSSFSINFEKGEIEGNYPLLISWEGHTKQILNEVLTHIEYKFEETSRA